LPGKIYLSMEVLMRHSILSLLAIGLLSAASNDPQPRTDRWEFTLPAGTNIHVRLLETLDTRRNRAGDRFTASLDQPVVEGNRVVVPRGAMVSGHLTESKPSGRFKGRAVLAMRLDSLTMNGRTYPINSTTPARVSKGHKKHHLLWIGGGSAGGALIGAAAGGGVGALIGAGAGAAAGTVGSVITGKRQVRLPVESTVRFRLRAPLTVTT
jgi:hypothetical protein